MTVHSYAKEEGWKLAILKAQNGDRLERDTLVTANMGLVYMVIKRFANRGYEQEDLFQIGVIGLLKAIDRFDVSTNFTFSTYAVPLIIGEIRRFLRDDGMIHVSRQIKDNIRKITIAKENLKKQNYAEPTMNELVKETGLSLEEIVVAMEAVSEVESIDQPIGGKSDGSLTTIADQMEDRKRSETELINRITVSQMLDSLEGKERKLIELRYLEGKTQTESAKLLGMNQVGVSRLEKKILLFLRKQL